MNGAREASEGCATIMRMAHSRNVSRNTARGSSHGKLIAVVAAAASVIVLALLSAFAWPGWALNHGQTSQDGEQTTQRTSPSIKAEPLPDNASELLGSMPDSVVDFARVKAEKSTTWKDAAPIEEYTVTYSTGDDKHDVTLTVAQWTESDDAKGQYEKLSKALEGRTLASGAVKVSGGETGAYVVKSAKGSDEATALWRNDTVVFQASGTKEDVQRFYPKFPL